MTEEELLALEKKQNAAIIAPAGHGKTEMVADMVEYFSGKQLVLTHTNAGVDAIQKRLKKRQIPSSKFAVFTIAAFCMKWGYAYSNTAMIDTSLSPIKKADKKKYYVQVYPGAVRLFEHSWAGNILKHSYTGIIVDEYQDCTLEQHKLILKLNEYLPVKVLGDPLQGIFGFKEPIVDWNKLDFEVVNIELRPWRWDESNPQLGEYLTALRSSLIPTLNGETCYITIKSINHVLQVVSPTDFNGYAMLANLKQYDSVLYLTKWEQDQIAFCKQMPGVFQHDEKQDCELLFFYADVIDQKEGVELLCDIFDFIASCATKVPTECRSFISRLERGSLDFSMIKKHSDLGMLLLKLGLQKNSEKIIAVLNWFYDNTLFNFYRKELYLEMIRSIKYAQFHNINVLDAAVHIRNDPLLQKRYTNFKYISSRMLLSKGLEFDCVILDTRKQLTAKEFYVAMTRAKRMIYIISDKEILTLIP